jgi:hypothetical protein
MIEGRQEIVAALYDEHLPDKQQKNMETGRGNEGVTECYLPPLVVLSMIQAALWYGAERLPQSRDGVPSAI